MSIFSGLKDILGQINRIDGSIYSQGRDFADVYAKNIALEEEIQKRTEELKQANQTIITLNSVWDMMNSSQPLGSMLEKIVQILHEDMEYNFVSILKIIDEESEKPYLKIKATSQSESISSAFTLINTTAEDYTCPYVENSIMAKAVKERKIYSTPDIKGVIKLFFPEIQDPDTEKLMEKIHSKTCIFVPLHNVDKPFGFVIITSDREDITDTENNFLMLYANQIELAVTVAGLFEEVKKQAVIDPLTGIYNRRYFEENIIKEAERALRLKQPFSVISMDLDYLKKINDTYGHKYGDIAIKTISNVLKHEARSIDIPARIGGEEFNLLLPGVDSKGAAIAAERIRKSIESQVIDTIGSITASIGVATFLEHSDRVDELIELADQAMYKAKISGRNQVKIAQKENDVNWQQIAINTFVDILSKKRIPVDNDIAERLSNKLQEIQLINNDSKDLLYSVADIISQTYNRMYKKGTTKSKVILAIMLAKKIDLPKEEIDKLRLAVLLYDIGNIMIPEEIFNKKEPLTDKEKEQIRQHPIIAAREILKPISNIQDIIPIIENHHENWNGQGYPGQKSGIEIPVASQIILLVDAFYAMTQDRPYRNAYSVDEILNIIKKESGQQWNEKLADSFIDIVKRELIR